MIKLLNISLLINILIIFLINTGAYSKNKLEKPLKKSTNSTYLAREEIHKLKNILVKGNNLIIFRHAQKHDIGPDAAIVRQAFDIAQSVVVNPLKIPEQYKLGGMCLTELGKATSWLMGKIFLELKIPVYKVISSPTCRTMQMADIMFNGDFDIEPALVFDSVPNKEYIAKTRKIKIKIFNNIPNNNSNLLIIGHGKTALEAGLVDFIPLQGDALVFRKNKKNKLYLLGHLSPDMFSRMLKQKNDW